MLAMKKGADALKGIHTSLYVGCVVMALIPVPISPPFLIPLLELKLLGYLPLPLLPR